MTPDQVAEAQRRSSTFVARKENEASQKLLNVFDDLTPQARMSAAICIDSSYRRNQPPSTFHELAHHLIGTPQLLLDR